MKRITSLLMITAMVPLSGHAIKMESLTKLLEEGRIELVPKGTGIHEDESVEVLVKNTCATSFSTSIPVGWVFISEVPEVQDLIVVREEMIALGAGAQRTVLCMAFCCESSGSGPGENEPYLQGRMAAPELVAVALAASNGPYASTSIQSAIWVISNGHHISSMGAMDSTITDTLRMQVSKISGQEPPLYTLQYAEGDGDEGVCTERPEWITRNVTYNVPAGATLTVVAIAQDRKILQVLYDHKDLEPGVHDLELKVHVLDWPEGSYAIRAHTDNGAGARLMNFQL